MTSTNSVVRAGDVVAYDAQPGAIVYKRVMALITIFLLGFAAISTMGMDFRMAVLTALFLAGFGWLYGIASSRLSQGLMPQVSNIAVLVIMWTMLLILVPVSAYLAFSLFYLVIRAFPDWRGLIGVFLVMAIAIASQYPYFTYGSVVGPVISAMIFVGIHLAFASLWELSSEREMLIEELIDTRDKLAATERAAGIAAERQRIAHEIHDTLAQGLSSIGMLVSVVESDLKNSQLSEEELEKPLQRLELIRTTAADNLLEARAMIAALQPAALSKTNLEGALQRVAEKIQGPEVSVDVEGDERQLPMKTEAALLRIAQGALGNVAKHAQASRCHITVTYEDEEVRLDVVDDGVGFDPATVHERPAGIGHIGLRAISERARELGGEVVVESHPGEGTAVSVVLPIVADANTGKDPYFSS